jgi:hypothetical protein
MIFIKLHALYDLFGRKEDFSQRKKQGKCPLVGKYPFAGKAFTHS